MPAFAPTSGALAAITVGGVVLAAINWDLPLDGKQKDVSNFKFGRAKKNTLADAVLSFTLVWDQNDEPTAVSSYNLRLGSLIVANCFVDEAQLKFFAGSFTVATIGPKNEGPEGTVMMDVTAGLQGAITYPT